jgi:hypothetical protein
VVCLRAHRCRRREANRRRGPRAGR